MQKINDGKHLYRVTGVVQPYDWGGNRFIPSITGIEAGEGPLAEYWLGAHPSAPSLLVAGEREWRLDAWIAADPVGCLGGKVAKEFGRLPYLLKLLDVKDMLSIQVHPSKEGARKAFERENAAGVPLDAAVRNYRDDNHKPELMVAMSEFWLLHGFKEQEALQEILQETPELRFLLPIFQEGSYEQLYRTVMEMPAEEVNERLRPLVERILPRYERGELQRQSEDFWTARAAIKFSKNGNYDRGIFSIYLFNLVKLEAGEALFQDAGVPHAYLEGWNVEIMASSDNVLRGGLTNKHIDVTELLRHTRCEATRVNVNRGERRGSERIYRTTAPDFELSAIQLQKGRQEVLRPASAEILLLVSGSALVEASEASVGLSRGSAAAVLFPGEDILLKATEDCQVFRAAVPHMA